MIAPFEKEGNYYLVLVEMFLFTLRELHTLGIFLTREKTFVGWLSVCFPAQ